MLCLARKRFVIFSSYLAIHSPPCNQHLASRHLCADVTQPSLARQLLARRGTESDVRDPLASVVSASPLGLLERSVTLARSAVGAQQLRRTP